jgi:hypothetical protein
MAQQSLIDEIRDYCQLANIEPSTLGLRALGNSRILERIGRRLERLEIDAHKLRAYMAANPPSVAAEPTTPSEEDAA